MVSRHCTALGIIFLWRRINRSLNKRVAKNGSEYDNVVSVYELNHNNIYYHMYVHNIVFSCSKIVFGVHSGSAYKLLLFFKSCRHFKLNKIDLFWISILVLYQSFSKMLVCVHNSCTSVHLPELRIAMVACTRIQECTVSCIPRLSLPGACRMRTTRG